MANASAKGAMPPSPTPSIMERGVTLGWTSLQRSRLRTPTSRLPCREGGGRSTLRSLKELPVRPTRGPSMPSEAPQKSRTPHLSLLCREVEAVPLGLHHAGVNEGGRVCHHRRRQKSPGLPTSHTMKSLRFFLGSIVKLLAEVFLKLTF